MSNLGGPRPAWRQRAGSGDGGGPLAAEEGQARAGSPLDPYLDEPPRRVLRPAGRQPEGGGDGGTVLWNESQVLKSAGAASCPVSHRSSEYDSSKSPDISINAGATG